MGNRMEFEQKITGRKISGSWYFGAICEVYTMEAI